MTFHFGPDDTPPPSTVTDIDERMLFPPGRIVRIGNGRWALVLQVTKSQVIYFPIILADVQFAALSDFRRNVRAIEIEPQA